jgi:hypothetical protein
MYCGGSKATTYQRHIEKGKGREKIETKKTTQEIRSKIGKIHESTREMRQESIPGNQAP